MAAGKYWQIRHLEIKLRIRNQKLPQINPKGLFLATCNLLLITWISFVHSQEVTTQNRLEQFLAGLETFNAGFEQTLFNEFGEELETSTGSVYLMRPGKFHWVYSEPYTQFLISNGINLWIYDADLEQVTINNIGDSIEKSPASILTGDVNINEQYIVTELGNNEGTDWIELASRVVESQYNAINLGFRGDDVSEMVMADNLGQTTRIVFADVKRNIPLANTLFEFTPPEGVDILDSREHP